MDTGSVDINGMNGRLRDGQTIKGWMDGWIRAGGAVGCIENGMMGRTQNGWAITEPMDEKKKKKCKKVL